MHHLKSGPLSSSDDKLGIRIWVLRDQKPSLYAGAICNPETQEFSGGLSSCCFDVVFIYEDFP